MKGKIYNQNSSLRQTSESSLKQNKNNQLGNVIGQI